MTASVLTVSGGGALIRRRYVVYKLRLGGTMWLLLFVLWMILNGRITLELIIFGVLIASGVCFGVGRMVGYSLKTDLWVMRSLPILLIYIPDLIFEIIRSALIVMKMVFRADEPDPVIIEFHSGLRTQMQNVLLANSITLTPGTITVFQQGDHFVVHCLRREYGDGIESSSFVRLLRHIN